MSELLCPACGAPVEITARHCLYCGKLIKAVETEDMTTQQKVQQLMANAEYREGFIAFSKLLKEDISNADMWLTYLGYIVKSVGQADAERYVLGMRLIDSTLAFIRRNEFFKQFENQQQAVQLVESIMKLQANVRWVCRAEQDTFAFFDVNDIFAKVIEVIAPNKERTIKDNPFTDFDDIFGNLEAVLAKQNININLTNVTANIISSSSTSVIKNGQVVESYTNTSNNTSHQGDTEMNIYVLKRIQYQMALFLKVPYSHECLKVTVPAAAMSILNDRKNRVVVRLNAIETIFSGKEMVGPKKAYGAFITTIVMATLMFFSAFGTYGFGGFGIALLEVLIVAIVLARQLFNDDLPETVQKIIRVVGFIASGISMLPFIPYLFFDKGLTKIDDRYAAAGGYKYIKQMQQNFEVGAVSISDVLNKLFVN